MKNRIKNILVVLSMSSLLFSCGEETYSLVSKEAEKASLLAEVKSKNEKLADIYQIKITTSSKAQIDDKTYVGKKEEYYKISDNLLSMYSKLYIDSDNYLIKAVNYSSEDDSYYMAYDGKVKFTSSSGAVTDIVDKTIKGKITYDSSSLTDLLSPTASKKDITTYILSHTPNSCFNQEVYDFYSGNQGSYKMSYKIGSFNSDIYFSDLGKITEHDIYRDTDTTSISIKKLYEYSISLPNISLSSYVLTDSRADLDFIESKLFIENPYLED